MARVLRCRHQQCALPLCETWQRQICRLCALRQCWNYRIRIDGCAGGFLQQPVGWERAFDHPTSGVARENLEFSRPPPTGRSWDGFEPVSGLGRGRLSRFWAFRPGRAMVRRNKPSGPPGSLSFLLTNQPSCEVRDRSRRQARPTDAQRRFSDYSSRKVQRSPR